MKLGKILKSIENLSRRGINPFRFDVQPGRGGVGQSKGRTKLSARESAAGNPPDKGRHRVGIGRGYRMDYTHGEH